MSDGGAYYPFCPGKATWSEEIAQLFRECRVALETGILPQEGGLPAQDYLFTENFPHFVEAWNERNYLHVWHDVAKFTNGVLTAVFGKK